MKGDRRGKVVSQLLVNGQWNKSKVEMNLGSEEAKKILTIPLSRRPICDKLIWHYTKCGNYITSSSYQCAIEMRRHGDLEDEQVGRVVRSWKSSSVGRRFRLGYASPWGLNTAGRHWCSFKEWWVHFFTQVKQTGEA
ncbi:hypothetical protein LIER_39407 [Lithospermum erythrorhizon]|uniref:Uncharacterized protein n=1 Tax=Lithospermum erythrorhizon TaxID=34254 RepID=A0AAV3QH20_LITER